MNRSEIPFELELIEQAATTSLSIESSTGDDNLDYRKVVCRIEKEEVETSAFGILYTLSLLSFLDARPAGASEMHYEESDAWKAIDMLRCLEFRHGQLYFHADYVRGRKMKTTIEITEGGQVLLETSGRGTSASRWISTLQGKRVLTVIQGEKK